MLEICRKTPLARNMAAMAAAAPGDYNFSPRSYCLPEHRAQLLHDLDAAAKTSPAAAAPAPESAAFPDNRIAACPLDSAQKREGHDSNVLSSEEAVLCSRAGASGAAPGSQAQAAQPYTYILKPSSGSQGKGIHLVQTAAQVYQAGAEP